MSRVNPAAAYYVSQGRSVQRQANRQRAARRRQVRRNYTAARSGYVSQGRAVQRAARSQRVYGVAHPGISRPQAQKVYRQRATQARAQRRQIVSSERAVNRAARQQRRTLERQRVRLQQRLLRNSQAQARQYAVNARHPRKVTAPPPAIRHALERQSLLSAYKRKYPSITSGRGAAPEFDFTTPQLRSLVHKGTLDGRKVSSLKLQQAGVAGAAEAPLLKVLDFVARPLHASASAADAALRHRNVLKAAERGIKGQQHTTYSDVLKDLGVHNKYVRGIGGFGLDVLLDPTSYVTFGVSSVAKQAAIHAGEHAAEAAARRELAAQASRVAEGKITRAEAKKLARQKGIEEGRRVAKAHLSNAAKHGDRKGLHVSVAGAKRTRRLARRVHNPEPRLRPVAPTIRGTSAVGRGVKRGARPIARHPQVIRAGRKVRDAGAQMHAGIRPSGVGRAEEQTRKALVREARAGSERAQRAATGVANKTFKALDAETQAVITDAIERNRLSKVRDVPYRKRMIAKHGLEKGTAKADKHDEELRVVAREIRDFGRGVYRRARRSGALAGTVGERSRTREEVLLFGARVKPKSAEPLKPELAKAEAEFVKARAKLRAATTPQARAGAQRTLKRVSQRITNLRGQISAREAGAKRYAAQTAGLRASRAKRFEREARGYVPRVHVDKLPKSKKAPLPTATQHLVGRTRDEGGPLRESVGVKKPQPGAGKYRSYRASAKRLRETNPEVAAKFSPLTPEVLAHYGRQMATATARSDLNRKIFNEFGTSLREHGPISKADLHAMEKEGTHAVHRLRRGTLEELGPANHAEIALASRGKATRSGGQYAVIRRDLPERSYVRTKGPSEHLIVRGLDRIQNGWKRLALTTPGYLVRNFAGDLFNAYTDENSLRLAKNVLKGRGVLKELGDYERAGRKLGKALPEGKRSLKLTPEQLQSVATELGVKPEELVLAGGKINALQMAVLAEKAGAIRQGRILDLVETRRLSKIRGVKGGTRPFAEAAKRVEDTVRIATFLGGLERGLTVREAATRVAQKHFDYGDLTDFEKTVARRVMPFYTWTARNMPFQAQAIVKAPGKYAHVEAAREEGRKQAGLPVGYEQGLNPFEARQGSIPIKVGGKVYTASLAAPFTDLNDVVNFIRHPTGAPLQKFGEQAGPLKVFGELAFNYSLFYREPIDKAGREKTLTEVPGWAKKIAEVSPQFRKATHMVSDYVDQRTGKTIWAWPRKVDYASRQLPGPAADRAQRARARHLGDQRAWLRRDRPGALDAGPAGQAL
jgi:hypothetical protein